ncbi:MAG: hypothetical protein QNK04_32325 [Myxococcota bacterium]|nr:hypothetical protein [Myxococcota bacterium]
MAESVFEVVAGEVERRTDLSRLEARGTVRLALRESGLDARGVTADQMVVILRRVLPGEMRSRGIDDPEQICAAILVTLSRAPMQPAREPDSPEDIFRRLAEG